MLFRELMHPSFYKNNRGDFEPISTDIVNGRINKCDYDIRLLSNKVGYTGTDFTGTEVELELENVLKEILNNEKQRGRYLEKAKQLVNERHNLIKNCRMFEDLTLDIYNNKYQ